MAKQINLKYDKDFYFYITQTEKFLNSPNLKLIGESDLEEVIDKQIGEDLIFTSKYVFDTTDLGEIIKVHTPSEANAYSEICMDNVLIVKFYKT